MEHVNYIYKVIELMNKLPIDNNWNLFVRDTLKALEQHVIAPLERGYKLTCNQQCDSCNTANKDNNLDVLIQQFIEEVKAKEVNDEE